MNKEGCGLLLFSGAALIIFLILAMGFADGKAADKARAQADAAFARGQARAIVIEAQGQARLDSAQAAALTAAAIFPFAVLGAVSLLGISVALLAIALVFRSRQPPPVQLIERQIVYLPAPGQPRRQVWQALEHGSEVMVIPTKADVVTQESTR